MHICPKHDKTNRNKRQAYANMDEPLRALKNGQVPTLSMHDVFFDLRKHMIAHRDGMRELEKFHAVANGMCKDRKEEFSSYFDEHQGFV